MNLGIAGKFALVTASSAGIVKLNVRSGRGAVIPMASINQTANNAVSKIMTPAVPKRWYRKPPLAAPA